MTTPAASASHACGSGLPSRDTEVRMQFSGVALESGGGVSALVIDGREI